MPDLRLELHLWRVKGIAVLGREKRGLLVESKVASHLTAERSASADTPLRDLDIHDEDAALVWSAHWSFQCACISRRVRLHSLFCTGC